MSKSSRQTLGNLEKEIEMVKGEMGQDEGILFSTAMIAKRQGIENVLDLGVAIGTAFVKDTSEAEKFALEAGKDYWSENDGWTNHSVSSGKIKESLIICALRAIARRKLNQVDNLVIDEILNKLL